MFTIHQNDPPLQTPATTPFVPLCPLQDLPVGLGRAFNIANRTIAVFLTRKGKIFALDNRCPHNGGPLADGMLAGDQVVCPLHAFRFEMSTGQCDQPITCPLQTYPLQLRDNHVFIQLSPLT